MVTSAMKKTNQGQESRRKYARDTKSLIFLLASFVLVLRNLRLSSLALSEPAPYALRSEVFAPTNDEGQRLNSSRAMSTAVKSCTQDQLNAVLRQLPPNDCVTNRQTPYNQKCSHLYATRCPDAMWLEDHYSALHEGRRKRGAQIVPSFTGIFVGCNKGFDAVNAMRMGSGDPIFDVASWKVAMTEGGKTELHEAVCGADDASKQFHLPRDASYLHPNLATIHRMYCIEPMPSTAHALTRSAYELGLDSMGFAVVHTAIAKSDGDTVQFPNLDKVGVENQGMENCGSGNFNTGCVNVTIQSLDSFVKKYIDDREGGKQIIDYLSIDVEGYDFDVLLGGQQIALPRVRYLEFEYNWMGAWSRQKLEDAVTTLDEIGFTCYWAGFAGRIWRITKCWLEHYGIRFWSNVACVNRNLGGMEDVVERMEEMFLETLKQGE